MQASLSSSSGHQGSNSMAPLPDCSFGRAYDLDEARLVPAVLGNVSIGRSGHLRTEWVPALLVQLNL